MILTGSQVQQVAVVPRDFQFGLTFALAVWALREATCSWRCFGRPLSEISASSKRNNNDDDDVQHLKRLYICIDLRSLGERTPLTS